MYNILHIRDIQSSCGHICCKQQTTGIFPETIEILQSLSLVHVGMKWQWLALEQCEKLCQAAHTANTVTEDECSSFVKLNEIIEIEVLLLKGRNDASFCQSLSCHCGSNKKLQQSPCL